MLFASTAAAKVEGGAVVATGTFAALIAPVSPFREGFPENRAKTEFGVYPISPAPTPGAEQISEAVAPYYDADADKVFSHQLRSKTTDERASRAVELTATVKSAAEAARLAYLTPGSAKALEYEAKRTEAMAYLAAKDAAAPSDPTINGTLYPWAYETAKELAGGEPSTAQIKVQCELFAARAVAWEAIGRRIAAKEQAATEAIEAARAAGDDAAMETAAMVNWSE
jgi:hypothetical protein